MTNQVTKGNSEKVRMVDCTAYSEESSETLKIQKEKRSFIRFDKLEFDKKYNIVYAPNGTGKTTLARSFEKHGEYTDGDYKMNITFAGTCAQNDDSSDNIRIITKDHFIDLFSPSGMVERMSSFASNAFNDAKLNNNILELFLSDPRKLSECILLIEYINGFFDRKLSYTEHEKEIIRGAEDNDVWENQINKLPKEKGEVIKKILEFKWHVAKSKTTQGARIFFEECFSEKIDEIYLQHSNDINESFYIANFILIGVIREFQEEKRTLEDAKKNIDSLCKFIDGFKVDGISIIYNINTEFINEYREMLKNIKNNISKGSESDVLELIKNGTNRDMYHYHKEKNEILKGFGYEDYKYIEGHLDCDEFLKLYNNGEYKTSMSHFIHNTKGGRHKGIGNTYFMNEGLKNVIILINSFIDIKYADIPEFKEGEKLTIIIDDPLSSTDDIRTDSISNYIAKFLVEHDEYIDKVIILTHRFETVYLMAKKIREKLKERFLSCRIKEEIEKKEKNQGRKLTEEEKRQIEKKVINKEEATKEQAKKLGIKELYKAATSDDGCPVICMNPISPKSESLFLDKYKYYFSYIYDIAKSPQGVSDLNSDCSLVALRCRQLLEMFFSWYLGAESLELCIINKKYKDEQWDKFLEHIAKKKWPKQELNKITLSDLYHNLSRFIHHIKNPRHTDGMEGDKDLPTDLNSIPMCKFPLYTLGFIYCESSDHYKEYEKYAEQYSEDKRKDSGANNNKN